MAHVEMRSVNGRTLVVKQRLCPECQGLEADVESRIGKRLSRGTVFVTMDVAAKAGRELVFDYQTAERAVADLRALATKLGLPGDVTLADLGMVPGLFASAGDQRPRVAWQIPPRLGALVDGSLELLVERRRQEGATTVAAMIRELDQLVELLARATERAAEVVGEHRDKLLRRVNEFLQSHSQQLEQSDVVREVALYADRADVSEELQRLGSHLDRLREHLGRGGALGRTLEFLLQESLREANTLGSKSQDAPLAQLAVDLKSGIDKLKEQAANLE